MRISNDPRIYEIHTSTYLFYAISLNMLPNRAKSFSQ